MLTRKVLLEPIKRASIPSVCFAFLLLTCGPLVAQSWPDWLARRPASLNADLLVRLDDVGLAARSDIQRIRGWLRPGFDVSAASWLRFGARGSFALSSDNNRDNIPRFDNFHSDDVSLDRFYLAAEKHGWEVLVGKFAMPFRVSEMIWDQDIQPRGVSVSYRRGPVSLRGAVFHRSHIHHDRSTIAGGQLTVRQSFAGNWAAEADFGFLAFNALDQFQPGMERQNRVRVLESGLRYLSAFELAILRYRLSYRSLPRWPVTIESTFVHNAGATDERQAVEVLAQVGKIQNPRDWHFAYSFQRVQRDAIVGAFTSDDWWFHSDHRGSRVTAAFTFLPHMFIQFGGVFQRRQRTSELVERFQIDVGARF